MTVKRILLPILLLSIYPQVLIVLILIILVKDIIVSYFAARGAQRIRIFLVT